MNGWSILLPIAVPSVAALLLLTAPGKSAAFRGTLVFSAVLANLTISILWFHRVMVFDAPWFGPRFQVSFRLYQFSSFILLAAAGFAFLIAVYSIVFMKSRASARPFFIYFLLTAAFVNGAVLANNLVVMLFFWEGLLALLFGMIMTGGRGVYPTAVKALALSGTADLCLMLGVCLTAWLAGGEYTMDRIHLPVNSMGGFAFILLMIGATAKAGAMPFHSWIPDAATDAPLPFMAFLPASLEKLLGIYLLARISLDMFDFRSGTTLSIIVMTVGAVTILLAVMMALVQRDYKRLLSYHAISQVGYMILGIGTALPIGIVGGLFHMLNHAMYKSCLFLTGGSVERQAGTTDLRRLGGLGRKMPVTFACFIVAAASISGVPPFNGFFSKELVFDGALESGAVFYIAALLGAFFTAASFLKLGHTAYLGDRRDDGHQIDKRSQSAAEGMSCDQVQTNTGSGTCEAPWPMLLPMGVIAAGCIIFGVFNPLPLKNLIEPVLGTKLEHTVSGLPHNWLIAGVSAAVLALAFLNHLYGVKRSKSSLGAADHIHHAPGLRTIYRWAELRYFDPYDTGMRIVNAAAWLAWRIDRGIDWIYGGFSAQVAARLAALIEKAHTGRKSSYLGWSIAGLFAIAILAAVLSR